jgi:hypothetical protein
MRRRVAASSGWRRIVPAASGWPPGRNWAAVAGNSARRWAFCAAAPWSYSGTRKPVRARRSAGAIAVASEIVP